MSYTQTPNYSLYKPTVNADNDQWGTHLNSNADTLDSTIHTLAGTVPAASTTVPAMDGGSGTAGSAATFARGDHQHPTDTSRLALAGGTMTGNLLLNIDPTTATQAATKNYVDTTVAPVAANANAALNDSGRSLIHNGTFVIQQRGTGPWTITGTTTADRWWLDVTSDTVSVTVVALVDADRTAIGDENARFALQRVFTGNAAAGAFNDMAQGIERIQQLSGKTATVSFWAIRTAGTATRIGVNFQQYFGSGGTPSATTNATAQAVTISTTWTRYSVTIAIPSSAGKTFGTNGDDCTYLYLGFSSGTTNNALYGNIGVQSGTIRIYGVQVEFGSTMTQLARRDPQQELALCQRFYQVQRQLQINAYAGAAGAPYGNSFLFPVTMRATPSIAFANTSYGNASGITAANVTVGACYVYVLSGTAGGVTYTSDFTASADL